MVLMQWTVPDMKVMNVVKENGRTVITFWQIVMTDNKEEEVYIYITGYEAESTSDEGNADCREGNRLQNNISRIYCK